MKKYLVDNSIGGPKIMKAAWDYLVDNYIKTIDDKYNLEKEVYEEIWAEFFPSLGYKDEDDNEEFIRFPTYKVGTDRFRTTLRFLVEQLHYEYKTLDDLNDGHSLRIIEVPEDGLIYHIEEDPECGAEYLSQVHKNYVVSDDWYMRAKYLIKDFCRTHEDLARIEYVIELGSVRIAFDSDFGLAQCKDDDGNVYYMQLHRVEYYRENDEHAKISYDIVNEDNTSNFYGGIYRDVISETAMKAYCKLFERLN